MLRILLYIQFVIFVVRCDTPQCATNGNANTEKQACQCRGALCTQYQTCEPEGNGGKGNCKAQVAVGIPADQRHTKCPTDGRANPDKESCECNFQHAALCSTGQICHPDGCPQGKVCDYAGNDGRGYCERNYVQVVPADQRHTKCPTDGEANPEKEACECNLQHAALCPTGQICHPDGCPQGKVCDYAGNDGRGYCERNYVKPGPKPSGGSGGVSGGSADGWSGAGGDAGQGSLRCQTGDGSLLPSATICEDRIDASVCRAVFSSDEPGVRSSKCDLPDLAETALRCAKTCKICCERAEHGCADDGTFGIDCALQKSKCKEPQWTAVMSHACPSTCGLCNAGACRDAIAGCASLKNLCRDITYRSYMEKSCARTCQACRQGQDAPSQAGSAVNIYASKCFDAGANCSAFVNLCNDASWQNILRNNCAKTCGLC